MESMMRTLAIMACLIIGLQAQAETSSPESVSGKVFLDANGNGALDPGEKGLADIRVTDGVNFAVSGNDGTYNLRIADDYMIPYRPARTVSTCWPSGKWPSGRWWHRLSDVKDARAVHFGLREDEQKLPFAFLHGSDCHSAAQKYTDCYAHDARLMMPAVKFIFNTGDTGGDGAESCRKAGENAALFPVPMFITPGNHDFVGEDGKTPLNQESGGWGYVTKNLGPVRWSFDYAGVHFLSLEYMEKDDNRIECKIPHVAVKFMEQDLASVAPGTRVVLLVHCYDASADFLRALRRFRVDQILYGHVHLPDEIRIAGVPARSCDSEGLGVGIVTDNAMDFTGRRSLLRGESYVLGYFKNVTKNAMLKRRLKQHQCVDKPLDNATWSLHGDPESESVEIIAEILPGSSKKVGFRTGNKQIVEITFDGTSVHIAGTPVPFTLIPQDLTIPPVVGAPEGTALRKIPADLTIRWHLLIDRDRLSIYANDLFCMTKAIKVDQPAEVTLLAEGGKATIKNFELWELKAIINPASRGLHHFAPPAWKWGWPQYVQACLEDGSPTAKDMLKRVAADGVTHFDIDP